MQYQDNNMLVFTTGLFTDLHDIFILNKKNKYAFQYYFNWENISECLCGKKTGSEFLFIPRWHTYPLNSVK
jgi:hypothetical protein